MRLALAVIGSLLIVQGLQLSLFIKAMRRAWAILQLRNDAELRRGGVAMLLVGCVVLACVA